MELLQQDNDYYRRGSVFAPQGIRGLVIRLHLARDTKGADSFLVGVILLCLFMIFVLLSSSAAFKPKIAPMPPEKIAEIMVLHY